MSYIRRYGARIRNHAQWMAHVAAFGPEPELRTTWRCPVCKRRVPIDQKYCCK